MSLGASDISHVGDDLVPRLGVDSADSSLALWSLVTAAFGRKPQVWFRYIGGEFATDQSEIAWLHSNDCAVGLVYNEAFENDVCGPQSVGEEHARNAIRALKKLGAPAGVTVFCDIESSWSPSAEFIIGWADTLAASPYSPGVYCNPNVTAVQIALSTEAAVSANVTNMPIWSAESEPGGAPTVPAWNPIGYGNFYVGVWQWQENWNGVDCDLVTDNFTGLWEHALWLPSCTVRFLRLLARMKISCILQQLYRDSSAMQQWPERQFL